MLELKNVTIRLKNTDRVLLENMSYTLNPGDKTAIIGEEGNGKSTLLKLIAHPEDAASYCDYTGQISARGTVGYLAQELEQRYRQWSIQDYLAEDGMTDGTNPGEQDAMLRVWGMALDGDSKQRSMSTLSGGEQVKVRMAKILSARPDLLLLDEPTNDIDLETLEWLESFISSSRLPILYISHDETLLENTANSIIHLEQIRRKTRARHTIERIGYREYVERRMALLDRQDRIAHKQRSEYTAQMERWRQIYNKVEHQQKTITRADPHGGKILKKKIKSLKSQEERMEREAENFLEIPEVEEAIRLQFEPEISLPKGKRILELDLNRLYADDKRLSENIRLDIVGPEHIGIIGRNGIGKTTLLKEIYTLLSSRRDLSVGYMPQNYEERLGGEQTPVQFLTAYGGKDQTTKARTYMGSLKFTREEMTGKINALSGGQRAKLLLLDLVLKGYNVLILDEPTRNFSPLSNPVIREMLQGFAGAIISVSHDRKYLHEVCTALYELTPDGLQKIGNYHK